MKGVAHGLLDIPPPGDRDFGARCSSVSGGHVFLLSFQSSCPLSAMLDYVSLVDE